MSPRAWKWVDRALIPLVFVMALLSGLGKERHNGRATVLLSDAEGYYLYLPATFIYHGWQVWDGHDGLAMMSCCAVGDSGTVKTRYTYGVAALEAPFFLAAHAYTSMCLGAGTPPPAELDSLPADAHARDLLTRKHSPLRGQATGFSEPYGTAVIVAAAFYLCLGLWCLRAVVARLHGETVARVTVLLVALATNLYYYATVEAGMSHVYSFFLFAAWLWLIGQWMERPTWLRTAAMGLCLGLILLIRPTNLMVAALLLGWEVYRWGEWKARLRLLLARWPHLLGMGLAMALLFLPQALYWHHAWGDWVVWSYEGEGFSNAARPKVLQVLFSHQNGLFPYTPIALAMVGGIAWAWRRRAGSAPVVAFLFLLATYTFASWWAWWFGGAFGHRCYVEFYALLALPLASVVRSLWEHRRPLVWWAAAAVMVLLVFANLRMTGLYSPPWDGPDWTFARYLGIWKAVFLH